MADLAKPNPGQIVPTVVERLLTPEELTRASDWVNEKAAKSGDPCQVCGSTQSFVQPSVASMPGGVNPYSGAPDWRYPCVVVICYNCGFMRYFNARVMGLLEDPGVVDNG